VTQPISPLSVSLVDLPEQQTFDDGVFPAVFLCDDAAVTVEAACEWVASRKQELCQLANESGAVLFRDFGLKTARDFDQFVESFDLPHFAYEDSLSNAVRINKTPRVFTANEAPPDVDIFFHHEMAQTPIQPSKLFFFCEQPAETGGATPLCRSDVLWERLIEACPQFATDIESKGLKYSNVMPGANDPNSGMGRSWQSTFKAGSHQEAEQRMAALGYSWEWLPDDCLRATTPILEGVRPLTHGRKSFFNQLIAAFMGWKDDRNDPTKAITFGDDAPLDKDAVLTACRIADEITFDVQWQSGDVALVDNYVTMHARRSFTGTRKVLASLVAAE
jgi:Taurine catabolism dioxygenase TauD, TfdA family